jgi:hypothetical protein
MGYRLAKYSKNKCPTAYKSNPSVQQGSSGFPTAGKLDVIRV